MDGLLGTNTLSPPQPQGEEHSSQVSLSFQVPGSPALLGAFYLCYESGRAAGVPKGSRVFLGTVKPLRGAISEVPLGPERNRWLSGG